MALLNIACRWGRKLWGAVSPAVSLAFAMLAASSLKLPAETPVFKEYQIKAAFLYNFTQFVYWPTNAFPESTASLVIGILGNDPFGSTIDDLVRGEKVNGHPLTVARYHQISEVAERDCHILFICQSEAARIDEILRAMKNRSILTVGETEGFAKNGGMIRLITERSKTRLRINAEAAKEGNLLLSAKLLKLAEIVTTKKE